MIIDRFYDKYRFLSNFYMSPVQWDGHVYPSVEHAYQAAKTKVPEEIESIRNAETPAEAKRLGQKATLRSSWDQLKLYVMADLVRNKFDQSPTLAQKLLDTGNATLIEGNTWGDRYWGVCNGDGENYLGKILMMVRNEIRAERNQDDSRTD